MAKSENVGRTEIEGYAVPLQEYEWALTRVLRDWKSRSIKKPRETLPVEFTAGSLRYMRQSACRSAGVSKCEVWTDGERYVAFGDVPCQRCEHPGISNYEFSAALFGQDEPGTKAHLTKLEKDELLKKNKRVIRRLINSEAPMQPDEFRRVLANAWLHRWISATQVYSIHQNLLQLEAASSWLRRFMKRLRDRVSFRNRGIITDDPATVAGELDAERRVTQEAFLEDGRRKIACARHLDAEDKQWLLRQICVTEDAKLC